MFPIWPTAPRRVCRRGDSVLSSQTTSMQQGMRVRFRRDAAGPVSRIQWTSPCKSPTERGVSWHVCFLDGGWLWPFYPMGVSTTMKAGMWNRPLHWGWVMEIPAVPARVTLRCANSGRFGSRSARAKGTHQVVTRRRRLVIFTSSPGTLAVTSRTGGQTTIVHATTSGLGMKYLDYANCVQALTARWPHPSRI